MKFGQQWIGQVTTQISKSLKILKSSLLVASVVPG